MSDTARTPLPAGRVLLGLFRTRQRSRGQAGTAGPRAHPRGRLFRKYVLLFIGLVSFVLLLNSALDFWFTYDETKAALFLIQQEKAGSAARRIEQFVDEIERQLGWTTAPQWATGPLEQRKFDYVRLLRQVPAITELIQLDDAGKEQLKVSRLAIDVIGSEKDYSETPSFIEARKHRVWFSPVYFRKESEPYMTLAMARSGRNAGVTIAEVNLKLIWDVITGMKIGQGGYAYVVDRGGRLIAHPDISLVLRNTDLSKLPQVAAAHSEGPGGQAASSPVMIAKSIYGGAVLTAHAAIASLGWTVFVELPLNEALAPLYGSALRTAALLALALGLATLAALLLARRMVVPIRLLQAGAARIGAGELDRRIDIHTGDEFEGLAGDFNRMAEDLQKSYAGLERKVEERTAELTEALDQQTATAEVLQVINASPGDLAPVFDAMLEKAMRLCEATFGVLWTYDGDCLHATAIRGATAAYSEFLTSVLHRPATNNLHGRLLGGERLVHFTDVAASEDYNSGDPMPRALVELGGGRTLLAAPLRKDNAFLGDIVIYRREVRPFSDKQIALLQNFAAQAVIAMENARLITETREALDQQTATAEVLGVINSSPSDLTPVFGAILEKAHGLCGVTFGTLQLYDGEKLRAVATRGFPKPLEKVIREPYAPELNSPLLGLINGGRFVQIRDLAEHDTQVPNPRSRVAVDLGIRTLLFLPLRKDNLLLGLISAARTEAKLFSEREIALLENFAAQAVIAMENARLITETREALEQQTATAEVLQVINSSPGDLAPVFQSIVEKAHTLCGAACGSLQLWDGEKFRGVAMRGFPEPMVEVLRAGYSPSDMPCQHLVEGERVVHCVDLAEIDSPVAREGGVKLGGVRTILYVALRKDDVLLGQIVAARQEVRPFSEKEIALVESFAAQAVIAMENARLLNELRERTRDLQESLEYQTATSDVLRVISQSGGELGPVLDTLLETGARLCKAEQAVIALRSAQDGLYRYATSFGYSAEFKDLLVRNPVAPGRGSLIGRTALEGQVVHLEDAVTDPEYTWAEALQYGRWRTGLGVPLLRDGSVVGTLALTRTRIERFTDKQIELVKTFADQAVIAMENARLITETREALEQQTATAEVLGVINSSPGDLAPVFDAILEKAHSLCGAAKGSLVTFDGEHFRAVATRGLSEEYAALLRASQHNLPGSPPQRLLDGESLVQIPDIGALPFPIPAAAAEREGARTVIYVPLRKDAALLGYITAYRQEVRPFSDKQIALLQNFAAQAVIAMENARLITETREALEQQTATAEVLQVINSSPGDLAPVFDAMLDKATRLCEATFGIMQTYDGERLRTAALHRVPAALAEWRERDPLVFGPGTAPARIVGGEDLIHTVDLMASEAYQRGDPSHRALVDLGGARSHLIVALRKDSALLGTIAVYRQEVRPFSDKQIALLQNFAAQAVIAIENVRLITELRQRTRDLQESLEYQTATSDVLRVISRSGGELEPVLQKLVETAVRICEADKANLLQLREGMYGVAASAGFTQEYKDYRARTPIAPDRGTVIGRMAIERRVVHIEDALNDPDYYIDTEAQRLGDFRTMLAVPLLRERAVIGGLFLARSRVEPFTEKQIALVSTFADQAVIAIENARLFNELRERTDDLQESLEYQTATSDVLKVISQSTFDLQPVLGTLAGTASRLCEAQMAFVFRREGDLYRVAASVGFSPETKALVEAKPVSPGRGTVAGRTALTASVVHIPDARLDPEYTWGEFIRVAKTPTMLGVPLLREGVPVGVIVLARERVEPFSDKQIELVRTFADQAVIAIENARLFNELRARTDELGSSVAELKMLSEVAQAVSSTLDLKSVLSTILNASLGVTWANAGAIFRYIRAERAFRLVEAVGWDAGLAHSIRDLRIAESETAMGEAVARRAPIQLADLAERPSAPLRDITLAAGFHSALIVPLVGAERIFGAIILMRQMAGEFPPESVRLMQTLASQSVLAIQNARLFREIADKSEQLALASQHKSQFLANMSHELRTPLNAILGYAELLVDGIYGQLPERPSGVLERIQNNGRHLLALINDVLDLAKIEAGQLTLTLEDYSLPEMVQSVVTATEPLAASKGLKFTAAVQDNMPMAHGDARRVSQVLLNLVGNAIKFTDEGEVEIRAAVERGQVVLSVRDTGPGIPDADQERIFGEFQQIDNSNTRKKGGTGLGLAISKRMVEMQGGTISVESVLGQGSIFRVVLPVHVDEVMEAA